MDLPVAPFQSRLGGNDGLVAHALESRADDLLGHAEAVYRCRIDQIDALMQGCVNSVNRFALVGSAPHPAAHGPRSERHSRDFELRFRNIHEFSFDGRNLDLG